MTINGDATVESDENFMVNISNVSGATLADGQAVGTITNDDGGSGTPTLSIGDVSISEGNSGTKLATFTVIALGRCGSAVTYTIATADGTATAGSDYVASSLSNETIAAGATSKTFAVTLNGDTTTEPDETFTVTHLQCRGRDSGRWPGHRHNQQHDDGGGGGSPTLSIGDVSITEGNSLHQAGDVHREIVGGFGERSHLQHRHGQRHGGCRVPITWPRPWSASRCRPAPRSKTFTVGIKGDTDGRSRMRPSWST